MSRAPYAQRLNRDVSELFSHNFDCSASSLKVLQTSDSLQISGSLVLQISIFDGPYRSGCFIFGLSIPENYPFRPVEVFASQPIWHPNIDLFTGKVALPMEWSPVLTLNSLALAVQMLLLEPSAENPLNMDAYSYYISQSDTFEQLVQKSIDGGCIISGVKFSSVKMTPDASSRITNNSNNYGKNGSGGLDLGTLRSGSPQSAMAVSSNGNSPLNSTGLSSSINNFDRHLAGGTPYHFNQEQLSPKTTQKHINPTNHMNHNIERQQMDNCKVDADQGMEGCAQDLNLSSEGISRFYSGESEKERTEITSATRLKKRGFEHTESSMELESLCRQEAAQASSKIPGLVRLSSMDEWNQRIAMAYSQLSLGNANARSTSSATATISGGAIGAIPAGTYSIANRASMSSSNFGFPPHQSLPEMQEQMQMQSCSVSSELDKLSMSLGHGNVSERSLSSMGMEVCSPYKRVKFYLEDS